MADTSCGEPLAKKLKTSKNESPINKSNKTQILPRAKCIKVGSRASQLALFQSNFVIEQLKKKHPELVYEVVKITTTGDKILNTPLPKIGQKSLFTKELEVALDNNEVQMVVHSLKDLPTTLPPGMVIGAICKRENPFDAVVFRTNCKYKDLKSLPKGSVIGTSSLRRIAQLKRVYPHLKFLDVRGNLNTRLRKLDDDQLYDALILAAAGLKRMDLESRISCILPPDICMYAVGQGALAVECKDDDPSTLKYMAELSDERTTICCVAERSFMKKLEGGCSVPIAVNSTLIDNELHLEGGVYSLDGSKYILESLSLKLNGEITVTNNIQKNKNFCGVVPLHLKWEYLQEAENLGYKLAEILLKKGAREILEEARKQNAQK